MERQHRRLLAGFSAIDTRVHAHCAVAVVGGPDLHGVDLLVHGQSVAGLRANLVDLEVELPARTNVVVREFESGEQPRHGDSLAAGRRVEFVDARHRACPCRVSGALHVFVAAAHHELEFTLCLRTSGELLGHVDARIRHVLRGVLVREQAVLHGGGGDEMALPVVCHLHGDRRGVPVVRHTRLVAGDFGDGVTVDARTCVHDLSEVEARGVAVGRLANGDGGVLRHRGAVLALDRELELLVLVPCHAVDALVQREVGGHTGRRLRRVLVHELRFAHLGFCLQIASAIVGHGDGDLRRVAVVGDAGHVALRLLDRVLVRAHLVIGDIAEYDVRRITFGRLVHRLRQHAILRAFRHRSAVLAGQRELERAVLRPRNARQLLRQLQIGRTDRHLIRLVCVDECGIGHFGLRFELSLAVVGHCHGHRRWVLVVGDSGHIALRLLHLVLILTGGLVLDVAEVEGLGITGIRLADGLRQHAILRAIRHRSAVLAGQRELELAISCPFDARQLLREFHTVWHAVERLSLVGIREGVRLADAGDKRFAGDIPAEAVVDDGERGDRRTSVMRHAVRRCAGVPFAHIVHIGAGLTEGEVVEVELGGVAVLRLAHRHRLPFGHRLRQHVLRHIGLVRIRRQIEGERFAVLPVTTGHRLRELERLTACRGCVLVREVRDSVSGAIHSRFGTHRTVTVVVDDLDADLMRGEVVGHAVLRRRFLCHVFRRHFADCVLVGLACVVLREPQSGEQCAIRRPDELLPADCGERVGRRRMRRTAWHRGAILWLDEPELAGVHRTSGERLANAESVGSAFGTVIHRCGVRVREQVVAVSVAPGFELAVIVGHLVRHGMRVRVVGPAGRHRVRDLLGDAERIGSRLREYNAFEVDVGGVAVLDLGRLHRHGVPIGEGVVVIDLDIIGITRIELGLEGELTGFGIASGDFLFHLQRLRLRWRCLIRVRELDALRAVRVPNRGDEILV